MTLLYQESEIDQFILSDIDRGLHPVRVITDTSEPAKLTIELNYFDEKWKICFSDFGDQLTTISEVVNNTELLDLFDIVMVQNEIPEYREEDLVNCLTLIKEYYAIVKKGFDISGWRELKTTKPMVGNIYCLGKLRDDALSEVFLAELKDDGWYHDGHKLDVSDMTHWYDDVTRNFYAVGEK